jgi:hypothetical protein
MADRKPPSPEVELLVLTASRRRCCLCYGLNGDLEVKQGQLAHLNRDPSDSSAENLAFLCLPHHDWFDTKPSQSKGATTAEAKHYREELYKELQRRDESETSRRAPEMGHGRPLTASTPPPGPTPFKSIDVIDERLHLRWIIRVPPEQWLTQVKPKDLTPAGLMRILDGPFHAVPSCNERLEEYRRGYGLKRGMPVLGMRCLGCKADLFKIAEHDEESRDAMAWWVMAQALAELQRMHRSGTRIEGPRVVLERPLYWENMLPPGASPG